MLRIYHDAVRLVALMRPLWDKIGGHNRKLRKQLARFVELLRPL